MVVGRRVVDESGVEEPASDASGAGIQILQEQQRPKTITELHSWRRKVKIYNLSAFVQLDVESL